MSFEIGRAVLARQAPSEPKALEQCLKLTDVSAVNPVQKMDQAPNFESPTFRCVFSSSSGMAFSFCVVRAISAAPSVAKIAVRFLLSSFSRLSRWVVHRPLVFLILTPPSATLPSPLLFLRCLFRPFGLADLALARKGWRSLPILGGLLQVTQGVLAKEFENIETISDGTES